MSIARAGSPRINSTVARIERPYMSFHAVAAGNRVEPESSSRSAAAPSPQRASVSATRQAVSGSPDVGMVECRDRTRFALEPFGELCVGDLDCDWAIEPRVAGPIHVAHATGPQRRGDFVGAQAGPCGKRHGLAAQILR